MPSLSYSSRMWSELTTVRSLCLLMGLLHYIVWVYTLVLCSSVNPERTFPFPLDVYAWSIGQTLSTLGVVRPVARVLTQKAWDSFATRKQHGSVDVDVPVDVPTKTGSLSRQGATNKNTTRTLLAPLDIPTLRVQDFLGSDHASASDAALSFLESTYGADWRERPLLLQGLWTHSQLEDPSRRLTPSGLLSMNELEIPYFTDALVVGALKPDGKAPVATIVANMLQHNRPHKIGSQFLVQEDPSLLEEVAPHSFLEGLFGNHFSEQHLNRPGRNRRLLGLVPLPGTTTVPVFVANTRPKELGDAPSCPKDDGSADANSSSSSSHNNNNNNNKTLSKTPFTGLHCEPIANVAVQLWGSRTWTLVDPSQTWKLKPAISSDGRSFYPSWIKLRELRRIPRYEVTTHSGDAVWLPTWTYHRVDYVYSNDRTAIVGNHDNDNDNDNDNKPLHQLSIGASLFHFRPYDYLRRNPLFAVLLVPSLIRELAGTKTQ